MAPAIEKSAALASIALLDNARLAAQVDGRRGDDVLEDPCLAGNRGLAGGHLALSACGGGGGIVGNARCASSTRRRRFHARSMLANGSGRATATAIDSVSGYAGVAPAGRPCNQRRATGSALATLAPSVCRTRTTSSSPTRAAAVCARRDRRRRSAVRRDAWLRFLRRRRGRDRRLRHRSGGRHRDAHVADLHVPVVDVAADERLPVHRARNISGPRHRQRRPRRPPPRRRVVTLTSQEVASLVLTPTSGGTLVNGAALAQQGAYTAGRNTSARIRSNTLSSTGSGWSCCGSARWCCDLPCRRPAAPARRR